MLKNTLKTMSICTSALALALSSSLAYANGGHFLVDDATITDPGTCQLETWISRSSGESVWHLMPACSSAAGWEFTLPLIYSFSNSKLNAVGLEAKTILTDDFANGALAISVGVEMDTVNDEFAGGFINIPYSRELTPEWTLSLNAGTAFDHANSNWSATWGAASAFAFNQHFEVIAEVMSSDADNPTLGLGARYQFNRFDLDASVARDTETNNTIYTIGVNIAF